MPKGERRNRKEILLSLIEAKDTKIDSLNAKIERLAFEKQELRQQLETLLEAEARAKAEARDKELLHIIKKHNITKEQLESLIDGQE